MCTHSLELSCELDSLYATCAHLIGLELVVLLLMTAK